MGYEDEQVFHPDGLAIEPGTDVRFIWDEGGHTLVVVGQPDDADWSGVTEPQDEGHTHEHAFDSVCDDVGSCDQHPDEETGASILVRDDLRSLDTDS